MTPPWHGDQITMHSHTLLDDTVIVEINHTEVTVTDPDDVQLYNGITQRLGQPGIGRQPRRRVRWLAVG